jgi:hypothetical protein
VLFAEEDNPEEGLVMYKRPPIASRRAATETPIETGLIEVSASVTARDEIGE